MNKAKPSNPLSDPINVDITEFVPRAQNEPSVARVNATTILVAANDFRSGDSLIGLYRSTDGGFTWDTSTTLPTPFGFPVMDDSYVRVIDNRAIVSAMAINRSVPGQGAVFSYVSDNSGSSFSGPFPVSQGPGTVNNDRPYLAIDKSNSSSFRGKAYISYTQFTSVSSTILFQTSPTGIVWTPPIALSIPGDFAFGASITVGPSGEVYVGWIDFSATTFQVAVSLDGGSTFGPPVVVSGVTPAAGTPLPPFSFRTETAAFLAADISTGPNSGNVYAVWMDIGSGFANIFLSSSSDGGVSWSLPIQVNDSPSGTQNFFPAIAVDPSNGTISVIYYTNRVTSTLIDVFIATSADGGVSFLNTRLSNASFNPNADSLFGSPSTFIGDYIDIDTSGSVSVWTSIPTNKQDIFIGFGVTTPRSSSAE